MTKSTSLWLKSHGANIQKDLHQAGESLGSAPRIAHVLQEDSFLVESMIADPWHHSITWRHGVDFKACSGSR